MINFEKSPMFNKVISIIALALTVILLISYLASSPFSLSEELKLGITNAEINIKETKALIEETEKEIAAGTAAYETQIAAKETELDTTNDQLDKECTRSYYSWWYCDDKCKDLHTKVETIENEISELEAKIESFDQLPEKLEEHKEVLAEAETLYQSLCAQRAKEIVTMIVCLIGVVICLAGFAGLGLVCISEFNEKIKAGICGAMVVGSLLLAIATNSKLFMLKPEFYAAIQGILFALILFNKVKKPNVCRCFIVALSVVSCLLSALKLGSAPLYALYSITILFISFVIVPINFTERLSIIKHIILSVITFGIWNFVWIYNVTKNLNMVEAMPSRRPGLETFLFIVLPFFGTYWIWKTAQTVEAYAKENNKEFNINVLALAISFITPFFSTIILQDTINQIVE